MVSCFPVKRPGSAAGTVFAAMEVCNPEEWKRSLCASSEDWRPRQPGPGICQHSPWAAGEQRGGYRYGRGDRGAGGWRNKAYEEKFGYGLYCMRNRKSARDMLQLLKSRLHHDAETEIRIAAGEQDKITALRLQKLLSCEPTNHSCFSIPARVFRPPAFRSC